MTHASQLERECATLGRELIALWSPGERSIFWDEAAQSTHEHPTEHQFEIATGYLDETTYSLSFASGELEVGIRRLDNYKLHDRARFVAAVMAQDDWLELRQVLERVASRFRALAALKTIDLNFAWRQLLEALFYGAHLGEPPDTIPELTPDPRALGAALQQVLEDSGRLVRFEWRYWEDAGLPAVQALAPLQALEAVLSWPTEEDSAVVQDSDNFYHAVLAWFDAQLSQFGLTLIALSPIDEDQTFALVSAENLSDLDNALQTLCIAYLAAPDHFDGD